MEATVILHKLWKPRSLTRMSDWMILISASSWNPEINAEKANNFRKFAQNLVRDNNWFGIMMEKQVSHHRQFPGRHNCFMEQFISPSAYIEADYHYNFHAFGVHIAMWRWLPDLPWRRMDRLLRLWRFLGLLSVQMWNVYTEYYLHKCMKLREVHSPLHSKLDIRPYRVT